VTSIYPIKAQDFVNKSIIQAYSIVSYANLYGITNKNNLKCDFLGKVEDRYISKLNIKKISNIPKGRTDKIPISYFFQHWSLTTVREMSAKKD
jgi:hypothetical protein